MKGINQAQTALVLTAALALLAMGAASALPAPPAVAAAAAAPGRASAAAVNTPAGNAPLTLVSYRSATAPALDGRIDGRIDDAWQQAPALNVALGRPAAGGATVDMALRSLHTDTTAYFLAQWRGALPPAEAGAIFNLLTMHWSVPQVGAGLQPLSCTAACHTGYADERGHIVSAGTETIPPGATATLPAGGGWRDGWWTLAWSRPLLSPNPYDVQFSDLSQSYPFFVKLFERAADGGADPISAEHELVFAP